jgi:hypothetical protein
MATTNKPESKIFTCSGELVVNKPLPIVFGYFADMCNDQFWRDEVKKTTANGVPELNCLVQQATELNKSKPLYTASYVCNKFIANDTIVYETTTESEDWQRNIRKCEAINDVSTRIVYTVEFEKNIIKHGMSVVPPSFMVEMFLTTTIKKYLQQLKQRVEASVGE